MNATKYAMIGMLVSVTTLTMIPAVFATGDDFTNGYSNGLSQGQIDRQAKVFHIGTICEGQTDTWCVGFTDGYLDGFFQGGIPSSSSHTTITIHEGGGHHGGHKGGDHGGCGHGNSTGCPGGGPPPPKGNETK